MDTPKEKRFSVLDALILIAATGAGLGLGKFVLTCLREEEAYYWFTEVVAYYAISVALSWTLMIVVLSLTRYRAPRRELACRAGFSACLAVVGERLANALYLLVYNLWTHHGVPVTWSLSGDLHEVSFRFVYDLVNSNSSAGAVAAVWVLTALAGCWRAEKTWLDRTGRALGLFWMFITGTYWLAKLIVPLSWYESHPLPTDFL